MSKFTNEQYNKVFWKLPQEIRDLVSSFDTTKHIQIVGQKHNLHIDQIGSLVDTTLDVMMGMIATKDFINELQDALQIGALEASVIARDVDENIFRPIKETMTHLYAGRAPYKPSSSLVQYYEEDEEHPALNKEILLKEIEDPIPVEVKKIIVEPAQKQIPKVEATPTTTTENHQKSEPLKTESHTNIIEYHQEISDSPKPKNIIPTPTPISPSSKIPNIAQDISKIGLPPTNPTDPEIINIKEKTDSTKTKGDDILTQLASIKLSQAFVMPKGPEGIAELNKLQMSMSEGEIKGVQTPSKPESSLATPQGGTPNAFPQTTNSQSTAETSKPATPEIKIDPYRERI